MRAEQLEMLLADVAAGRLAPGAAVERLRHLPYEDLPYARIDHHRALRQGQPEVVFCEGKTVEQVVGICERLAAVTRSFLGTRATGRSFDDRVGSTALVLAVRRLDRARLRHTVIFVWSVREEIGLEGAAAAL